MNNNLKRELELLKKENIELKKRIKKLEEENKKLRRRSGKSINQILEEVNWIIDVYTNKKRTLTR